MPGLVEELRGEAADRPVVDPGLAGGLRDWLEDSLAPSARVLERAVQPLRVGKETLNEVLVCEAMFAGRSSRESPMTHEAARGLLVYALFRQWVTVGHIDDPYEDALGALSVGGDASVNAFVSSAGDRGRRRLEVELAAHAASIVAGWPLPVPTWLGRTQERIEVPLCGGALVLSGVVDLLLGAPSAGRASTCLVELKSGARRLEHRGDLHYYALLETLRSGAPPFRIATYYSSSGELDAERVGEDVLRCALQRVVEGASRLCRLASGEEPSRTANPLCAWCTELPGCRPGQDRARIRVPRVTGDPRDECLGLRDMTASGADEL